VFGQPLAHFLVQVNEHLGVAARHEAVAAPFEVPAQVEVVVDLAVEDHLKPAVLIAERLVAARNIDDAEAAVAEPERTIHEVAGAVGAAVRETFSHPPQRRQFRGAAAAVQKSCDPAHKQGSFAYHHSLPAAPPDILGNSWQSKSFAWAARARIS
jgi:hypothetical protein